MEDSQHATIKCLVCGFDFTPINYKHTKYCTIKCSNKHFNDKKKANGYRWKRKRYPSYDKSCLYCNREFVANYKKVKYCSRECCYNAQRSKPGKRHTEESKKKISEARIKTLKEKGEHGWSNKKRKESMPETNFRVALTELGISAYQNYIPTGSERLFEFDFAFPEHKIAVELNGMQHYGPDGYLAPYYQERHDYLTGLGWTVHEVHYSECFYNEQIKILIKKFLANANISYSSSPEIVNLRVEKRLRREQERQRKAELKAKNGQKQSRKSKGVPRTHLRKVVRPSKEELTIMIWETPTTHIAKKYGVSDNAVAKWCKNYNISKPPRGYWAKTRK